MQQKSVPFLILIGNQRKKRMRKSSKRPEKIYTDAQKKEDYCRLSEWLMCVLLPASFACVDGIE